MRFAPSLLTALALVSSLSTTACKGDTPAPATGDPGQPGEQPSPPTVAPTLPAEGPLASLRTGVDEPEQLDAATIEVIGHSNEGAHYYSLKFSSPTGAALVRVELDGAVPGVAAIHSTGEGAFVRIPSSATVGATLRGTAVWTSSGFGNDWQVQPFTTTTLAEAPNQADLPTLWANAWISDLRGESRQWWSNGASHPWREFAAGRVQALVADEAKPSPIAIDPSTQPRRTELSQLMHTTTAATSMQEALQYDRGLRMRFQEGPATIPIAELEPPALAAHPFAKMLAALPKADAAVPEPLAKATPSEFWYVRFDDIRVMLRVLDEADAWITPVAQLMEERAEVRDLAKRYQAQLGLRRSGLAKALGHTVIERVAVVGSDPYLREGSDLTMLFTLRNQAVFDTELARHMDEYRAEVPGITEATISHGAHTITVLRDPTGTVRQHRAFVAAEQLAIVSTSRPAIEAVLDTIDGKRRRLADDEDLGYMLARDPGTHDGLVFLGDQFIASVVGPRQKILAARRQQALAELLTPGYAALLYGWLEGQAPADTEALISAGLLDREELRHADGTSIEFAPGGPARSSWGSPASLIPLLELPSPTLVTEAERDAYAAFARDYQDYWRQFIDPIAIRLDVEDGPNGAATASVDIRVLPLIEGSDYGEIEAIVGTQRISVPAIDDGLQMVWAVGADSDLRRDLDRSASALTGKADIGIGWLGDWVMVGTLDRNALLDLLVAVDEDIQVPIDGPNPNEDQELARLIGKLPVYAAAQVRNPMALVATLTAIKAAVNEVAPGMVVWGEHSRYREHPIVRVGLDPKAPGEMRAFVDELALYYVVADDVFVLALDPKILEVVVDRVLSAGGPTRGPADAAQFVMEARVAEGRAGWTAIAWALQGQANRTQSSARTAAEILLRGDPSRTSPEQLIALGQDYFGTYPISASGRTDFALGPYGVSDPIHGSEVAPRFPALPVEGSPIAALMARLTVVRATIAFDREPAEMTPPARSLHTRFELQLGASKD